MGEPETARGRDRKRAIVEAAAALMYERGVRGTSINDVLRSSRAGKSQLYHYFDDKEDLVSAVLEHQLDLVLGELEVYRLETWTGLRAWFDALADGQQRRGYGGCPLGSLAVELSGMGPEMQQLVATAFCRWEDRLSAALRAMQRRGRLSARARPDVLAATTLAAIQGGYLLSTARHEIGPMRSALAAAYDRLRAARDGS